MTGYLRRDLLERHLWRTGLRADVELVAEPTALAICGRALSESDARGLLEMCGLIHPDGPGKVDVRVTRPRLTGAAPVRNAHRKRSKL